MKIQKKLFFLGGGGDRVCVWGGGGGQGGCEWRSEVFVKIPKKKWGEVGRGGSD